MWKRSLVLMVTILLARSDARLVRKTLDLTWETGAPNGVSRQMIFTNGQYPGPHLFFHEDDDVEVTVNNYLPFNTSVHWHGMSQHDSPWSDGVPGLSQAPILPNTSFIYRFKASPAGTYWYHSHVHGILQDGQVGAMFIRRKPGTPSPYHLITDDESQIMQMQRAERNPNLLVMTDWSHLTSVEFYQAQVASGWDLFCVDSLLINGKGSVFCPGAEYLQQLASIKLTGVQNGTNLTDKGCLQPNLEAVQSIYLESGHPSAIPPSMHYGCEPSDGGMFSVEVDPEDGWASINFIAAEALKGLVVSIDNHPMWVYEADGGYVIPRQVEAIEIFNGARYSVMIKLDQPPGNYSIRVSDNGGDQIVGAFATLAYRNAGQNATPQAVGPFSKGYIDYGGSNTSASVRLLEYMDSPLPFNVPPPPSTADQIHFTQLGRLGGAYLWTLGGHELFVPERSSDDPVLQHQDPTLFVDRNAALLTLNDTWVDVVIQVLSAFDATIQPPHPIHKHGNKAYIVGHDAGIFHWATVNDAIRDNPNAFNLDNPPFRDTFTTKFLSPQLDGGWWVVIRYQVQTPGAFIIHCHIATHQQSGMALAMLDGVDAWPVVPPEYETNAQGYPPWNQN